MIRTLAAFDLEATRFEGLTGVWLDGPPRKICSIGVHISRWVTTHGYALNVDLDPAPFTQWITACGLEDASFTTMARELGGPCRSTRSVQWRRQRWRRSSALTFSPTYELREPELCAFPTLRSRPRAK